MYISLYFSLITFYLVQGSPYLNNSPFFKYNIELLKNDYASQKCSHPDYYIEMANLEESKLYNRNKIILYHGESYGTWIYQLLMKSFLFPEAPDDWLPLRTDILNSQIDKKTLLNIVNEYKNDHHKDFSSIGISVNANLYSSEYGESAWSVICKYPKYYWNMICGLTDRLCSRHDLLFNSLKQKFIPTDEWERFDKQLELLQLFIQTRRWQPKRVHITDYKEKFQTYFPYTTGQYTEEFESFFRLIHLRSTNPHFGSVYKEGVLLQIIMERELANEIVYNAHPYGWLKDNGKYSIYNYLNLEGNIYKGEDFQPYSQVYEQIKNQEEEEQARLVLNNDFRQFPSRVRIKAIAGIMEESVDYEILLSLIREMVKKKDAIINEPISGEEKKDTKEEYEEKDVLVGSEQKDDIEKESDENQESDNMNEETIQKVDNEQQQEKPNKKKISKIKKFKKFLKGFFGRKAQVKH